MHLVPALPGITGVPLRLSRPVLLRLLGLSDLASKLRFQGDPAQRPLLFFVRGTMASEGLALDVYHRVLYTYIEVLTGIEVVDVKLDHNGLRGSAQELEKALAFIQGCHARQPHRPSLVGGWSRGALVAAEAAMRYRWVLGVVQITPPTHGSWVSQPWMPGTLGSYGLKHPVTQDYCQRLDTWAESPRAVPMLVLYAPHDVAIRPPRTARVEHSNARNVPIPGLVWNHGNLPFAPRAIGELSRFIHDVLAAERRRSGRKRSSKRQVLRVAGT